MKKAIWLTTTNVAMVEMASTMDIDLAVFDLEHGIMDPSALEALVGLTKAHGISPFLKTAAPEARFVMESLDRGADGIVIPQVQDFAHAKRVSAYAKYPVLGKRGASGGRVFNYARADADFYHSQNTETKCLVMIETAGALADVEAIAGLATVDGLFVGPTDLALSLGRGAYMQSDQDFADIAKIAQAAKQEGKLFVWPAWSAKEQVYAVQLGADIVVVADEMGSLKMGLETSLSAARQSLSGEYI
ncbi:HpcH/HpaI aldolase family protein [Kordiimonas pumila]|uniref:HpcH/HpaI aldolase/citrate lyase family protein n=1 Tax=Kordiimonas pumila TaxID=2161677 RepID=A0ABV7D8H2_9PROT|nr:aldolase/citrate lyase family protein [Kordiimonas pumila]